MLFTSVLGSTLLLQGIAATPVRNHLASGELSSLLHVKDTKAFAPATPLTKTSNVLTLKSTNTTAKGSSALHNALRAKTAPLIPTSGGQGYAININFGGHTFEVLLDTGSSDLWLAQQGVKCVNVNKKAQPVSACGFGPLAGTTFQAGAIKNENFNISYGDGEFLTGVLGYENVGIAGVTVNKQETALVNYAYWEGDGVASGLIGFA